MNNKTIIQKMKLTNREVIQARQAIQVLEDMEIEGDLVWAVVINAEELEQAHERYQKAYQRHVNDQIVRDENGDPVYPEGVDPDNEQVDPKFEDKGQLVEDLNNLLSKEVELDLETVTKDDMPTSIKPKVIRGLRFMIEDL
jgi:hypothetical protein